LAPRSSSTRELVLLRMCGSSFFAGADDTRERRSDCCRRKERVRIGAAIEQQPRDRDALSFDAGRSSRVKQR
jgi:hypothetical protein